MANNNQAIYCESFGQVWRFSPRRFRSMLRKAKAGEEVEYASYGKLVCTVDHNITDLDEEQAADLLADLLESRPVVEAVR
jgi:hypothetical protein